MCYSYTCCKATRNFLIWILFFAFFFIFPSILNSRKLRKENINLIEKYSQAIEDELNIYIENLRKEKIRLQKIKRNNSFSLSNQGKGFTHSIKKGDTMWSLGKKYNLSVGMLLQHNPQLKHRHPHIGEKILISSSKSNKRVLKHIPQKKLSSYHLVSKGETFYSIAKKYHLSVPKLRSINSINHSDILQIGQRLKTSFVPSPSPTHTPPAKRDSLSSSALRISLQKRFPYRKNSSSPFIWPLVGGKITSIFGPRRNPFQRKKRSFHRGIDIATKQGTKFRATRSGIVVRSSRMGGYGNCIFIQHAQGYISIYAHNRRNLVRKGQLVKTGQIIGTVGKTGLVTGSHLHFEIRKSSQAINPLTVLKKKSLSLNEKNIFSFHSDQDKINLP